MPEQPVQRSRSPKVIAYKKAWHAMNRERVAAKSKIYREKNKHALDEKKRLYRESHRTELRAAAKRYYAENIEKNRAASKIYRQKNADKIRAYTRRYHPIQIQKNNVRSARLWASDPIYRMERTLRTRLLLAIKKKKGAKKCAKTEAMLGCTKQFFRAYIESKFQPGMAWENYGMHGWHLDHIRPCASFDLSKPEDQFACFHFTNLQPLWAIDNRKKGARLNYA